MAICNLVAVLIQGHALGGLYWIPPIVFNCVAWPTFLYWQYYSTPKQGLQFELEYERAQKAGEADDKFIEKLRGDIDCMSKTCIFGRHRDLFCHLGVGVVFVYVGKQLR